MAVEKMTMVAAAKSPAAGTGTAVGAETRLAAGVTGMMVVGAAPSGNSFSDFFWLWSLQ
jgi:hypothetical protein